MLQLVIPDLEFWNPKTEEFLYEKGCTIQLEHSLVSISKWEAKYHKAFLGKQEKTNAELIDYIRFMTITQNVPQKVYTHLKKKEFDIINAYIDNPMSAVKFFDEEAGNSSDTVTSELIYYWMIALNIPFECQKWHLNRLLSLIRVCNMKNRAASKSGKRSQKDILRQNAALNAERRKKLNSKG